MIFKKLKREKIKKQLAIETARAVIVTHWTKKVTVEKPQMNGAVTNTADGLVSVNIIVTFICKLILTKFVCIIFSVTSKSHNAV